MKKALILGTAIICFVAMTGCKTKSPKVAHPYVKEYVASYKTGSVNVKDYLERDEDFAIGADENGKAVFKNPEKAYDALIRGYSDGINLIRDEYKLGPLTRRSFKDYEIYGWQVNTGSEEEKKKAAFVSGFFDIYENSFDFD